MRPGRTRTVAEAAELVRLRRIPTMAEAAELVRLRRIPTMAERAGLVRLGRIRTMAEGAGFEPARELSPPTRFPVALLRPARTPLRADAFKGSPPRRV